MDRISKIAERIVAQNESFDLSEKELAVAKFFKDNPDPKDEDFHKWAEGKKYDVHEVESLAYRLATMFTAFLFGGRANEKKVKLGDVDKAEMKMGIKVESEHVGDKRVAARIALDHLAEIPDYYSRLKKMESAAGIKD